LLHLSLTTTDQHVSKPQQELIPVPVSEYMCMKQDTHCNSDDLNPATPQWRYFQNQADGFQLQVDLMLF